MQADKDKSALILTDYSWPDDELIFNSTPKSTLAVYLCAPALSWPEMVGATAVARPLAGNVPSRPLDPLLRHLVDTSHSALANWLQISAWLPSTSAACHRVSDGHRFTRPSPTISG